MHGERWLFRRALGLFALAAVVTALSPTTLGLFVGFSLLGGLAAGPLVALPWAVMRSLYVGRQREIGSRRSASRSPWAARLRRRWRASWPIGWGGAGHSSHRPHWRWLPSY